MTRCSLSKKLTVRSDRGYVVAPPETFSTGFFEQTQTGMAPVADSAVIEASLAILAKRVARGSVLSSPSAVKNFLVTRLADLEYEIFGVVLLTTRHHLIDFVELFRGTSDGASVAPREVLKLVLARNAGAVILVHQHPSAVKDASRADELITATLRDALALIQVKVLDHILGGFCSVTTAVKIINRQGFAVSIANKGFNRLMVTLVGDLSSTFAQARTAPRESSLADRLEARVFN